MIEYTYEIVNVDENARCMEVVYSAEGHETMRIGTRLPFEGETLEQVIDSFAPVALWIEKTLPVIIPTVGQTGTVKPVEPATTNSEEPAKEPIFSTQATGSLPVVTIDGEVL